MKFAICLILFAFYYKMTCSQQCRQVTVCDDDVVKGDKGVRGKAGSKGVKGDRGEDGDRGIQGESCALGSLGVELMEKLTRLEELLSSSTTIAPTTSTTTTTTSASRPASCSTSSANGVRILQNGDQVLCEDGWTVFQRRMDGSLDFQRDWNDYLSGFGQMDGEFWLGLGKIHRNTQSGDCNLKIELWDFDDVYKYADYDDFTLDDEENLFRLHIGSYSGTAGDSLTYHNNRPFSSRDRDNDDTNSLNCVNNYGGGGGWWFGYCRHSTLNALWERTRSSTEKILWQHWSSNVGLKSTKMRFRCVGN
ncbi:fibrinogen-like protein A [Clavelina lepadiformis]|uniref:fibrinogen-like protein A n=1 Tax=Clavelina lepadiformis TaxID=159417 RepID=UPI004042F3F3